jgi:esterase/lipase superfamily enzyme
MTSLLNAVIAGSTILLFSNSNVLANNLSFWNGSDQEISSIVVSSPDGKSFRKELLESPLPPAREATSIVEPLRSRERCIFDITAKSTGGQELVRKEINLCDMQNVLSLYSRLPIRFVVAGNRIFELSQPIDGTQIEFGWNRRIDRVEANWRGYISSTVTLGVPTTPPEPLPLVTDEPPVSQQPPHAGQAVAAPTDTDTVVEILFATNRSRPDPRQTTSFGSSSQERLTLGAARILIPSSHQIGRVELPRTMDWLRSWLPNQAYFTNQHFRIYNVWTINRSDWLTLASAKNDVLIYVHGFNNSFQDALFHAAQFAWDTKFPGTVVLFSWPSRGGTFGPVLYNQDRNDAQASSERLLDLLKLLHNEARAERINIVAHSMGNEVVTLALKDAGQRGYRAPIGEYVLAAPDVDRRVFGSALPFIRRVAPRLTLYVSSADPALRMSSGWADFKRLGDLDGGAPSIFQGTETIDVSALGEGHSIYAQQRSTINDIGLLLRPPQRETGRRLPNERLPEIQRVPGGDAPTQYYRFVR